MTALIEVRGIRRTYQVGENIAVQALAGVDLSIERGEYVAIMGASGSGKSTLMHILGCLDVPTSGSYVLDGVDVADYDDDELADLRNDKIGFVFQAFNLIPRTPALAQVALPLAYAGVSRRRRRERAAWALRSVAMSDRAEHKPSELSGGQQQRVAVARALVMNPALILADEPTGNLDSRSTADVLSLFDELHDHGRTIVVITHEDHVADRADRVVTMADGLILTDDRRLEVLA
ncbi:MAG: ABC transporter ATP-binding protein [Solirubrobacteraceae bacterium]